MSDQIIWGPGMTLDSVEKQVILKAYRFYRFNKTATAGALGIAIRTLDARLEKYEQEEKDEGEKNERRRSEREEFLKRSRGTPPPQYATDFAPSAPARMGVEPAPQSRTQSTLSLPVTEEVQAVSPGQASQGSQRRRR